MIKVTLIAAGDVFRRRNDGQCADGDTGRDDRAKMPTPIRRRSIRAKASMPTTARTGHGAQYGQTAARSRRNLRAFPERTRKKPSGFFFTTVKQGKKRQERHLGRRLE